MRGTLGSSSIIWDLHKVRPWNFTPVWQKGLKLKVGKFWGLILTFDEVKRKNLAGSLFTWIGLKVFMITVNHIIVSYCKLIVSQCIRDTWAFWWLKFTKVYPKKSWRKGFALNLPRINWRIRVQMPLFLGKLWYG